MLGDLALMHMLRNEQFSNVVDIGSGLGEAASVFRRYDKEVLTIDLNADAMIERDFMEVEFTRQFDAVWCSHVLEHQPNVNAFLTKLKDCLKEDGIFAITVPPAKHAIVGGHLTLWNAGLLLYNLIVAGFDCSRSSGGSYGYNISVIGRKTSVKLPPLRHDTGDIERLKPFFPPGWNVSEGFDGNITQWGDFTP